MREYQINKYVEVFTGQRDREKKVPLEFARRMDVHYQKFVDLLITEHHFLNQQTN